MTNRIPESELILNPDGTIYHLNLKPEHIAKDIITVGDPDRVDKVAKHFDHIDVEIAKREFKTVTGWIGDKRITVISTGIGTDNIDIVITELDALVNIDLEKRVIKEKHTSLSFYRVGTSGSLSENLDVNQVLISSMAIGLDGLMHYYDLNYTDKEKALNDEVKANLSNLPNIIPYSTTAAQDLVAQFAPMGMKGITISATGFYGPQGRTVIGQPKSKTFLDDLANVSIGDLSVTNFEMETAGIYGMSSMLGHKAVSVNAIIANRVKQTFSNNPKEFVAEVIEQFLQRLCT